MKKIVINYIARTMWQLSFTGVVLMAFITLGLPEVPSAVASFGVLVAWYFLERVSFLRFFFVWPERFMGITGSDK